MDPSSGQYPTPAWPPPIGSDEATGDTEIRRIDSYALVAYIHGELGEFLYQLRQEIVPSCRLRSHVSLLPPRPLAGDEPSAIAQVGDAAARYGEFTVELGEIEVFAKTNVIYISLRSGCNELRAIHDELNDKALAYAEPYCYHPHITLAQEIPAERFGESLEHCLRRWREYSGARSFPVKVITFVQNTSNCGWMDLEDLALDRTGVRV